MAKKKSKPTNDGGKPYCPKTVGELKARLEGMPNDQALSFEPFSLLRIKDCGVIHFEMQEVLGRDFQLLRQKDGESKS